MINISIDDRDAERRTADDQIASEAQLVAPELPADAQSMPVESHLSELARPIAVAGVVENGLVRIVDPAVVLPEHARVIVVATKQNEYRSVQYGHRSPNT